MKFKLPVFLLSAAALSGCVDIPDFDNSPKIYYNGLSQFTQIDTMDAGKPTQYIQRTEMVVLSIRFEDGDGDLGVDAADIQPDEAKQAYKNVAGWNIPANYEVVTLTKQPNGSWDERIFAEDNSNFFPNLKPDGKPGPIKGTLDMYIRNPIGNSSIIAERRYKVRVIDRGFRISNQIEVPEADAVKVPVPRN